MLTLTDLEAVALSEIGKQHPVLLPQIAVVSVLDRENTGSGFLTSLAVDRASAESITSDRVLGNVWLRVQGFQDPMTFLLFMEDGFISCLEGATVRDTTELIDLCSPKCLGLCRL